MAVVSCSVHRDELDRVYGNRRIHIIICPFKYLSKCVGDGNGSVGLGIIASLLESALTGINVGDVINLLHIEVVDRVAADDERVDAWVLNTDGVVIRIRDVDIVEIRTPAIVQEVHGALHRSDVGTAHADDRQPLERLECLLVMLAVTGADTHGSHAVVVGIEILQVVQVLDPDEAGVGDVAMGQGRLLDARVTDVEVLQLVVVHQVKDIQASGVVIVHGVVLLVIGLLPVGVPALGVGQPQVLLVVRIIAVSDSCAAARVAIALTLVL